MFPLQSIRILNASGRNSAIDVYRALAIISVVLFHFHGLPYGVLWHPIFIPTLKWAIYLGGSFALSIVATILVEEPVLRMRKTFLDRFFPAKAGLPGIAVLSPHADPLGHSP